MWEGEGRFQTCPYGLLTTDDLCTYKQSIFIVMREGGGVGKAFGGNVSYTRMEQGGLMEMKTEGTNC